MEGTQRPTKIAPSLSPWNHMVSENIKLKSERNSMIMSTLLSFFNMILFLIVNFETVPILILIGTL